MNTARRARMLARSALWLLLLALPLGTPAESPPPRIVSLAPHLTELAYAAGIGDRLVGAVEWSDFPEAAQSLPRIGDAFRFDLERIVRLEATDALAWAGGTPQPAVDSLAALGVKVHSIQIHSLDGIAEAIERLGQIGHRPDPANGAADKFRQALNQLRRQRPQGAPIPVFYQVSADPLFTLGARHPIGEVLALCGARNVFEDLDAAAASVDFEAVLKRWPMVILASADDAAPDALRRWRRFDSLPAVACDNLREVDPDRLVRPTPRILDGAAALCEWLAREVRPDLARDCAAPGRGDYH